MLKSLSIHTAVTAYFNAQMRSVFQFGHVYSTYFFFPRQKMVQMYYRFFLAKTSRLNNKPRELPWEMEQKVWQLASVWSVCRKCKPDWRPKFETSREREREREREKENRGTEAWLVLADVNFRVERDKREKIPWNSTALLPPSERHLSSQFPKVNKTLSCTQGKVGVDRGEE